MASWDSETIKNQYDQINNQAERIDELNQIIDGLKARIAELEALGPLIDDAVTWSVKFGASRECEEQAAKAELVKTKSEINAILKGGAPS